MPQNESSPVSETQDLDPILVPLKGQDPAGVSLKYDGIYTKIQNARKQDDATLPQGIWKKPLKVANYKEIEKLTTDALTNRSKDFQLMAWLTEAWFQLYHLEGLLRGLKLLNGLTLRFWETAYPKIKGKDYDYRLAPFHWMNEKFSERIPEIVVTTLSSSNPRIYAFFEWKEALALEREAQKSSSPDFLETAKQAGRPILEDVQKAIAETPSDFYEKLEEDLNSILQEVDILEKLLLTECSSTDISLYQFKRRIKDILDLIQQIWAERGRDSSQNVESSQTPHQPQKEEPLSPQEILSSSKDQDPSSAPTLEEQKTLPPSSSQNLSSENFSLQSRKDAYDILKNVQTYLMQTEPHSPAPYLIRRALKWENMNLEDMFQEILQETGDLNQILILLGIHRTKEEEKEENS